MALMCGPALEGFGHENKREVPKRKTDDDENNRLQKMSCRRKD
jgi:hypothetical protein